MNKSSFFIVGKHPVIEALKNPKRNPPLGELAKRLSPYE